MSGSHHCPVGGCHLWVGGGGVVVVHGWGIVVVDGVLLSVVGHCCCLYVLDIWGVVEKVLVNAAHPDGCAT